MNFKQLKHADGDHIINMDFVHRVGVFPGNGEEDLDITVVFTDKSERNFHYETVDGFCEDWPNLAATLALQLADSPDNGLN